MELNCYIQNYAWGKMGNSSLVAILKHNVDDSTLIEQDKPYAELWIGTHVNGPSKVLGTDENLNSLIEKHPEYLGPSVVEKFGVQLPFLFKVLSVGQALSIQAHPSKKHAEELHSKYPAIYKDPNHKPELAIALTKFKALCGFRPFNEIIKFINEIPELKEIVGCTECPAIESDTLRNMFSKLFKYPKQEIGNLLEKLLMRFKNLNMEQRQIQMAELIEILYSQYPNDVGCFVVYFLNYLELSPGEAIFLPANEPHAYLFGDCVECMANSDNVVRAGLTPKLIDMETLCSMLSYKTQEAKEKLFVPIDENKNCKIFRPPIEEFAVVQIQVKPSEQVFHVPVRKTASTLIVISGEAESNIGNLTTGKTLFVPAEYIISIKKISSDLLIYQAIVNI